MEREALGTAISVVGKGATGLARALCCSAGIEAYAMDTVAKGSRERS